MTHFREAQYFRQPWVLLLLAAIAVPVWWLFIRQMVLGIPFGNLPMPEALLILMTAGVSLTALWLWKVHLLTEVRGKRVAGEVRAPLAAEEHSLR